MPESLAASIPARVAKRAFDAWQASPSGCYISTYSVASHGYAQIGWQERGFRTMTTAHRAAWVHVHGQIPAAITVDHRPTCDKRCVNVAHLRLLTNFENGRRTHGRDWPLGECINGHPNSDLVREPWDGRLRCPHCKRDHQRAYRERKRAQQKVA